jgi:hypothetical protein
LDTILGKLLSVTIIIFMVGSLLEVGLKVKVDQARKALHNVRFLVLSVLWAYVPCPALAVLLTKIMRLSKPYAVGMLFLSMRPFAPFFPSRCKRRLGIWSSPGLYTAGFCRHSHLHASSNALDFLCIRRCPFARPLGRGK